MIAFIDDHRKHYGIEPIWRVLPIAPSTYHDHAAQRRDPERMSARAKRHEVLKVEVKRVFDTNFGVYGVRKAWRQLLREGFAVPRCTVERLMRKMGLKGVIRGRTTRTTIGDKAAALSTGSCESPVSCSRTEPVVAVRLHLSGHLVGFVYVAFVIDAYAKRIVGWRVSRTAHAGFVLDALEQALYDRRPVSGAGLVHHSDRGSQYASIKYTERLRSRASRLR